ncbi:MAG: response regulator transcription factor [Pseudomonadota bacterium]
MKVLLIEDDLSVGQFVVEELRAAGHHCVHLADGPAGLEAGRAGGFDVMVVDRMLPRLDGLSVVRTLRAEKVSTPVLFLSALGEVDDRVQGLQSGGDDYLVKPFSIEELMARLEVLYRRRASFAGDAVTHLDVDDLHMDLLSQTVTRGEQVLSLQPREYKLLEYLMRHADQVVTRAMLLEHVWGYHFDPQTNVIDVHISRLRQKIDREFERPLLHTVRGAGYRLGGNTDAG